MSAGTERFLDDAEMSRVDALTTFFGSEFQMEEASAGMARHDQTIGGG